ncbi:MAG: DUF5808 domain-containing protein [Candidatus Aminicenantales bacterium]
MRNDPGNYRWGIFYFNPRDSRAIVPKRNAWMGWTLNFARPISFLILLGIFLVAALIGAAAKIVT